MEKKIISSLNENSLNLVDLNLMNFKSNISTNVLSIIRLLSESIESLEKMKYANLANYDHSRLSSRIINSPDYSGDITKEEALANCYDRFIKGTFDEKITLAIINLLVFAIENDINIDRIANLYLENENIKKSRDKKS